MLSYHNIREAAAYLKANGISHPEILLVLGTGLSGVARHLNLEREIPYGAIPNFPVSTVTSHAGKFLFGEWGGSKVLVMAGRLHYYEGYSMQEVCMPVRVAHELGVRQTILTNAAGGLNPEYEEGDLVCITDHINLMPDNPLRGPNDQFPGIRFPDMSQAYNRELRKIATSAAEHCGVQLHKGIYAGLPGPSLETPAEYRYLHRIGADLVGMSTVPEVIAAVHAGLEVLAFSIVTNVCFPPERITETTVEEVIQVVEESANKLALLMDQILQKL